MNEEFDYRGVSGSTSTDEECDFSADEPCRKLISNPRAYSEIFYDTIPFPQE